MSVSVAVENDVVNRCEEDAKEDTNDAVSEPLDADARDQKIKEE